MKSDELEVSVNNKVVKLRGWFVDKMFCVDSSVIDSHPALSSSEKESIKMRLRSDKNILIL